jgi:very-short-patch-repair endonuclease
MATKSALARSAEIWALAERQHWVVTRGQLLARGMTVGAVRHRLRTGRLRRLMPGVYLVGRPRPTWHGRLIAAALACGPNAFVSHRRAGLDPTAHRRMLEIPVTSPIATLIDFATESTTEELEAAVNEASHRDLVDPETLLAAVNATPPRPGVRPLRRLLDRDTFVLTQTALERLFLRIVRAVDLPLPDSQEWLGEYRVDFHWPALGLVVECDSLRYHRTALKQAKDMRRDQTHTLAGRTPLRFSHHQVRNEETYVAESLQTMFARLRRRPHPIVSSGPSSVSGPGSSGSRGSNTK